MNCNQKNFQMRAHTSAQPVTRRDMLKTAAAVVGASSALAGLPKVARGQTGKVVQRGRIKQSICGGCLRKARLDAEETAKLLVEMGLAGRDLVHPNDWDVLKKHGLVATMVPGAGSPLTW